MRYLSYSGYKKYKECEHSYLHDYVLKTPTPEPDDRIGMLFGQTVGELFEHFYVAQLGREQGAAEKLIALAGPYLERVVAKEAQRGGRFDWKKNSTYKSIDAIRDDIELAIPKGLAVIRKHRLLGVDAAAEVKLDSVINGFTIAGRADFIMTRIAPHNDLVILDGKGTKHLEYIDLYIDERQLTWYSMLYVKKFGKLPAKTGFIYWKAENPDAAMDWREVSKDKILALKNDVISVATEITKKKQLPIAEQMTAFAPNPKAGRCRLCPYVFTCPSGQTILSKDKPDLSDLDGVEDVSM